MESNNENKKLEISTHGQHLDLEVAFIYKKTEKLVTAVYMLSNFFPHEEPIKWRVRNISLNLLSNVSDVFYEVGSDSRNVVNACVQSIEEIVNLLDLARISSIISQMNFSILHEELMSLRQLIETNNRRGTFSPILMTRNFFAPPEKYPQINTGVAAIQSIRQPSDSIKQKSGIVPRTHMASRDYEKDTQKTSQVESRDIRGSKLGENMGESKKSEKKSNRSEIIIKILGKKDNLTVKDISQVITDCSEKTIQRELLSLVSQNVLKKVGERRWSRYSLK